MCCDPRRYKSANWVKKKAQILSPTWWHGIAFEVKLTEIQVKLDMFGKIGLNDIT